MTIYWLLFLLTAWHSLLQAPARKLAAARRRWPPGWRGFFVLLVLLVGLRHEVGGDWFNYLRQIENITGESLADRLLANGEPAYGFLNWFAANQWGDIYLVNLVCGVLFCLGLFAFCHAQPRPWLAITIAIPYLVMVVAMGYSRQGVAIGLAMMGLNALTTGQTRKFFLWIIAATAFHKSALVLLPLAGLMKTRRPVITFLLLASTAAAMSVLLFQEALEALATHYIGAEMESSGALIRVAMNALPAAIFLLFRRRFALSEQERAFWGWMSWIGLAFVPLLIVSPSSTAVDRIALYWIPLQLFVLSRLPDALARRSSSKRRWVQAVVLYCAAVQFVWLFFATNANAWLPYRFYPWEWLWA